MDGGKYTTLDTNRKKAGVGSYINFRQSRLQSKESHQGRRRAGRNNKGATSPRGHDSPRLRAPNSRVSPTNRGANRKT